MLLCKNVSEEIFIIQEEIMLNFESDYTEGAHEAILKKLLETNLEPLSG